MHRSSKFPRPPPISPPERGRSRSRHHRNRSRPRSARRGRDEPFHARKQDDKPVSEAAPVSYATRKARAHGYGIASTAVAPVGLAEEVVVTEFRGNDGGKDPPKAAVKVCFKKVVCFQCKGEHMVRDCPRGIKCFNCGGDHLSTECPSSFKCFNCGGAHKMSDCNIPAECDGQVYEGISYRGSVKSWDPAEGYGWIRPDGGNGPEIYLHSQAIDSGSAKVNDSGVFTAKYDEITRKTRCIRCIPFHGKNIPKEDAPVPRSKTPTHLREEAGMKGSSPLRPTSPRGRSRMPSGPSREEAEVKGPAQYSRVQNDERSRGSGLTSYATRKPRRDGYGVPSISNDPAPGVFQRSRSGSRSQQGSRTSRGRRD